MGCNSTSALESVYIALTLSSDNHPSEPVRKVYINATVSLQWLRLDGVTIASATLATSLTESAKFSVGIMTLKSFKAFYRTAFLFLN